MLSSKDDFTLWRDGDLGKYWGVEGVRKGIRVGMAGGSLFLDVADVVYC